MWQSWLENLLADPRASTLARKLELAFNFNSELSSLVLKRKGPIFFVSLLVFSKIVISINSTFGLMFHTSLARLGRKVYMYNFRAILSKSATFTIQNDIDPLTDKVNFDGNLVLIDWQDGSSSYS